mgnify:FL=1|tara:strand:- start:42 stop:329 length:288 start_codon:yes stop_codon:yes gene_type:complete
MTLTKIVAGPNGSETVPLSSEEEAEREAEKVAWDAGATDRAWAQVREERNQLLAATDWQAMSDLTITDEQKVYRQALRDVPSQSDPLNITWPTAI